MLRSPRRPSNSAVPLPNETSARFMSLYLRCPEIYDLNYNDRLLGKFVVNFSYGENFGVNTLIAVNIYRITRELNLQLWH